MPKQFHSTNSKATILRLRQELEAAENAEASRKRGVRLEHVTNGATTAGLRTLTIVPTNSLIQQSILLLGSQNACVVAPGEKLSIHTDDGQVIHTEAVATGVKLKARKEIKAYLKRRGVTIDNVLTLSEAAPGRWALSSRLKSEPAPLPVPPAIPASPLQDSTVTAGSKKVTIQFPGNIVVTVEQQPR